MKIRLAIFVIVLVGIFGTLDVKAEGTVDYDVNWWGDCWYYDPPNPYPIQGAQYYYDNFTHTDGNNVTRYFYPLTLWYSGVNCTDERPYGFGSSNDGWTMEVDTPNKIKVWNNNDQLVYCHNYVDITQPCY